jgi:hypothetical protein
MIEDSGAARDQIQVTVGQGVEATRIYGFYGIQDIRIVSGPGPRSKPTSAKAQHEKPAGKWLRKRI